MKASEEDEKERKRKEIAASKQAKEQLLNETMESISRRRVEHNTQTKLKYIMCACTTVHMNCFVIATDKSIRRKSYSSRNSYTLVGN